MKNRAILFSGEMVRAILEGRKTQTRRVAKFVPSKSNPGLNLFASSLSLGDYCTGNPEFGKVLYSMRGGCWNQVTERLYCPYGQPGDRLWVRETFRDNHCTIGSHGRVIYAADCAPHILSERKILKLRWSPAIHMPRWASRITLEVKKVRVERVQEISKQDAIAEGISVLPLQSSDDPSAWYQSAPGVHQDRSPRGSFMQLWDSLNAKRGFGWEVNPWVWVIESERVERHA